MQSSNIEVFSATTLLHDSSLLLSKVQSICTSNSLIYQVSCCESESISLRWIGCGYFAQLQHTRPTDSADAILIQRSEWQKESSNHCIPNRMTIWIRKSYSLPASSSNWTVGREEDGNADMNKVRFRKKHSIFIIFLTSFVVYYHCFFFSSLLFTFLSIFLFYFFPTLFIYSFFLFFSLLHLNLTLSWPVFLLL